MPFAAIDGHRLAYRLRQAGPESLVFVHGLGASKNSFDRCFKLEIFSTYTLAAVDLPGCGQSSWSQDFSYMVKDQAAVVLRWIENLHLTQIILVGHSMGGVVCLYLAEALGVEAKAFFNLEGNLECADCTFSSQAASMSQQDFEQQGFEQFKSRLKEAAQQSAFPGLKNYYQNILKAHPTGLHMSSVSLVKESCKGRLKERFDKLCLKKWYVFGERSTNSSTKTFLDSHDIPYFIVPNSGHFMMDDQPRVFYRMLFEAIQRV